MRLAFCLFKYFPFGGMQKHCYQVLCECRDRGHEIEVFTLSWQGPRPAGVKVTEITVRGWRKHIRQRAFARSLHAQLQHHPADLLIGFNKIPGLDIYFAADPCYKERAQQKYAAWYRLLSPRHQQLAQVEQKLFDRDSATQILYISEKEKKKFLTVYDTPTERFHKIPPGVERVDLDFSSLNAIRAEKREELGVTEDTKLILFVGSGFKIKGLDRAIRAVSSLPMELLQQVAFVVVGQGRIYSYRKLAYKLGLQQRIFFLQGRDDALQWMQAADCLLHPAINETGGTVLLEAAINGVPVLTTDTCGYASYIRQANMGVVLPSPFQQSQLNAALPQILHEGNNRLLWLKKAKMLTNTADIFSLPQKCADVIEQRVLGNS